ncbi:hypothetical protein T5B8_14805 [Salinisphaera sp. T5B8]
MVQGNTYTPCTGRATATQASQGMNRRNRAPRQSAQGPSTAHGESPLYDKSRKAPHERTAAGA